MTEFPLFLFTTLGGIAAGACAVRAVLPLTKERKQTWLFPLICIALLGIGLIGVLFHLARPAMFLNALANPQAGIAQEAYCSIVFGLLLLADLICDLKRKDGSPRVLQIICGAVGLILTFIMGMSYVGNFGVPAWTTWATVAQFVVGDIAFGTALYLAFDKDALSKVPFRATFIAVAAVFAIVLVFEGTHFNAVGLDSLLFLGIDNLHARRNCLSGDQSEKRCSEKPVCRSACMCVYRRLCGKVGILSGVHYLGAYREKLESRRLKWHYWTRP